jgi:hypothetical protein
LTDVRVYTNSGGASIEIEPNMWTASGLKIDSAPTDVVWARGSECLRQLATRPSVTRTKRSTTKLLLVRGMER